MKIEEQYKAFVLEYIRLGSKLDVKLMDRLYDFDCNSAFNFLRSYHFKAPIRLSDYPAADRTLEGAAANCTSSLVGGAGVTAGDGTCDDILTIPANFHGYLEFTITSDLDTSASDGKYYIQWYSDSNSSKYGFSYLRHSPN